MEKVLVLVPDANLEFLPLDLASFPSIDAFADQLGAKYEYIDILLNNAGIFNGGSFQTTEAGFETQAGTCVHCLSRFDLGTPYRIIFLTHL